MGFERESINILKSMTTGGKARIITRYGLTDEIEINRGIRQGCPLAPLLFTLVLEPIWWKMEQEDRGIIINKEKLAALAYVDDVAFVDSTIDGLQETLDSFTVLGGIYMRYI